MAAEEGQSAPRQQQTILEIYVKIGAFAGVSLAVAAFAATCGFSYWVFCASHIAHLNSKALDLLVIFGTLICASLAAATTFLWASVFWLPIILGLIGIACVLQSLMMKYHQTHH